MNLRQLTIERVTTLPVDRLAFEMLEAITAAEGPEFFSATENVLAMLEQQWGDEPDARRALRCCSEGFVWMQARGLVAPEPRQSAQSAHWFFVTLRDGTRSPAIVVAPGWLQPSG